VTWGNAPSPADIRKLDTERLLQNPILTEPAGDDDAATADTLLESHSARAIAAAFVKLYRSHLPAPEEMPEQRPERESRAHKPSKARPEREREARPPKPRDNSNRTPQERERSPRGGMDGPWFLLNVGRERNADPKWLLPEICRQGGVTKADIGAIRVHDAETRFQVDARVAGEFAERVAARQKGGVRIFPAPGNNGEPSPPRHKPAGGDERPAKPHAAKKPFAGKKAKHDARAYLKRQKRRKGAEG
jgi:ATP-dependent RNA helicase DeaD